MRDRNAVATQLQEILCDVVGADVPTAIAEASSESLWEFGLTSAGFIRLLATVEEAFAVDWDLDTSIDAVSSFDNLVGYIVANAPAEQGDPR
jgi:acyl carrier protein